MDKKKFMFNVGTQLNFRNPSADFPRLAGFPHFFFFFLAQHNHPDRSRLISKYGKLTNRMLSVRKKNKKSKKNKKKFLNVHDIQSCFLVFNRKPEVKVS